MARSRGRLSAHRYFLSGQAYILPCGSRRAVNGEDGMFIAVRQCCAQESNARSLEKLKCIFMHKPSFGMEYIGEGRARYALATLHGERGWRKLGRICGKGAARIVSPSPVDERYAGRFEPSVFLRSMLFNTALRLTDSLEKRPDIALVDVRGVCAGFAGELALSCRRLRVLTCRPERYGALCRRLLGEYGALITVSEAAGAVGEEVCLMGDGELPSEGITLRTVGRPKRLNELLLREPETPEWAKPLIPPDFSPRELLGAMYELGREERCGELCAATAEDFAGNILPFDEAVRAAFARIGRMKTGINGIFYK